LRIVFFVVSICDYIKLIYINKILPLLHPHHLME
jgi:hypothetical protein